MIKLLTNIYIYGLKDWEISNEATELDSKYLSLT